MIVTDLQPVSIVEDEGFIKFVKVLDRKYSPPSRRTIMREHLPHLFEKKKEKLWINWLTALTDKWNITKKVHCTIMDAASNITGAVRSNRWNHLVCFAHKLNLIVSSSIDEVEDVKEIMDAIKRIVSFFL